MVLLAARKVLAAGRLSPAPALTVMFELVTSARALAITRTPEPDTVSDPRITLRLPASVEFAAIVKAPPVIDSASLTAVVRLCTNTVWPDAMVIVAAEAVLITASSPVLGTRLTPLSSFQFAARSHWP